MSLCPKCQKPLRRLTRNGVTVEDCGSCGYSRNLTTGAEQMLHVQGNSCIVKCTGCGANIRVRGTAEKKEFFIGDEVDCPFCNTSIRVPEKPDDTIRINVTCPHCAHKTAIEANKGKQSVECAHCKATFVHDTGAWPQKRSFAQQAKSPAKETPHQTKQAVVNECYQCPKCGWTHPNTQMLNESVAKHTPCGSCGNTYLIRLTWDD